MNDTDKCFLKQLPPFFPDDLDSSAAPMRPTAQRDAQPICTKLSLVCFAVFDADQKRNQVLGIFLVDRIRSGAGSSARAER